MLIIEFSPHYELQIRGNVSDTVLRALRKEFGDLNVIRNHDQSELTKMEGTRGFLMLVVVKTPYIDLQIRGDISETLMDVLRREYRSDLKVTYDPSELINVEDTEWYQEFKQNVKPGDFVEVYRNNLGLSHAELAKNIGITTEHLVNIEQNTCEISEEIVEKLSETFEIQLSRLFKKCNRQ